MSSVPGMPFLASHDATSKAVTASGLMLLTVLAVTTHNLFAVGIAACGLVAAYAWSPSGYAISNGDIVVRRLAGNVHIPLCKIRDVRAAAADDLRGSVPLFGSGGLFGYYGLFRMARLGTSTWYVTNRTRPVIIVTDAGTAVLSPDDVDGFTATIRKSITVPFSGLSRA